MAHTTLLTRTLVKDAKSVCNKKFVIVQTAFGTNDAEIKTLRKDIDRVFTGLDDPDIWTTPIHGDRATIEDRITVLGAFDQDNLTGIVMEIRKLLRLLEQDILLLELESPAPGSTGENSGDNGFESVSVNFSDMNQQVLGALQDAKRQISDRLSFFARNGQNLMQDADFLEMRTEFLSRLGLYTQKLEAIPPGINSVETDRLDIVGFGNDIAAATVVDEFKKQYTKLSKFIKLKLSNA